MNSQDIEINRLEISIGNANKTGMITGKTIYQYNDFKSNLVFWTPEINLKYGISNYHPDKHKYCWQIHVNDNDFINNIGKIDNIIYDAVNAKMNGKIKKEHFYGIIRKSEHAFISDDNDDDIDVVIKRYIKPNIYYDDQKKVKSIISINGIQVDDMSLDELSNVCLNGSIVKCKLSVSDIWINKIGDKYLSGVQLSLKNLHVKKKNNHQDMYKHEYMFLDDPYQEAEHVLFKDIDVSQIEVKDGFEIGTRKFISYDDDFRFCFETDNIHINFYGLVPKNYGYGDQYYVKIPVNGCTTKFVQIMSNVDTFFSKCIPTHKYIPIIKNSTDPKRPPYMKFNLCKSDNEILTSVFINKTKIPVKTLDDLREYLKFKSTIKMICQVSCMWINEESKIYGVSLKIHQLQIVKDIKPMVETNTMVIVI